MEGTNAFITIEKEFQNESITRLHPVFLLLVVLMTPCMASTEPSSDLKVLNVFENTIANIADQSMPAVVSVTIIPENRNEIDPHMPLPAASGFVFHKDGYILTNQHVVASASRVEITLFDGSIHPAEQVGADKNTDIAVLKIEREASPFLSLADTRKVRVGHFAIPIGHPIGYEHTVTAGIVGGKDRCFHSHESANLFEYHHNYIQTDAWINPGSSGGVLLNLQGEVIGVTTLNPGEGSTLAINSSLAKTIAHQLIMHGRVIRGYIDVELQSVPQGLKVIEMKSNNSAVQSDLKHGDIIIEFDEKKVSEIYPFRLMVADYTIGKQCPVVVLQQERKIKLDVIIEEMPLELAGDTIDIASASWKTLGIATRKLAPNNHQRYTYLTGEDRGILVTMVRKDSPASNAQIQRSSLITEINGHPMLDTQILETFLVDNTDESEMALNIKSIRGTQKVTVKR